jgi:hypothetical protein
MTAKNSKLRIVTLPGDGIGREVVPAVLHALNIVGERHGSNQGPATATGAIVRGALRHARAEIPIAGAADSAENSASGRAKSIFAGGYALARSIPACPAPALAIR